MRVLLLLTFVVSALCASTTPFFTEVTPTEPEPAPPEESLETEEPSCEKGDCISIKECISSQGQIRESTACTCPAVYCCYSSEPTTSTTDEDHEEETTTPPSSTAASSGPTSTFSTSTKEASTATPYVQTTESPTVTSSTTETSSSPAAESTSSQPTKEQSEEETRSSPADFEETNTGEGACTSWSCVSKEECKGMDGTEGINKDDCPEPYSKCCLPEF